MCGTIGIIGKAPVAPLLLEALKRLEYRGYDSAGIATLVNGRIERRRAEGKLVNLDHRLAEEPLGGTIGIGHTRWATHGKPSERNAHPIATSRVGTRTSPAPRTATPYLCHSQPSPRLTSRQCFKHFRTFRIRFGKASESRRSRPANGVYPPRPRFFPSSSMVNRASG